MTSQGNSTKHLEKLAPILKLLQRIVEEGTVQVLNITVILKQDKNIREKKTKLQPNTTDEASLVAWQISLQINSTYIYTLLF